MTVSSPINKLWKLLVLIILEGVVSQLVLWNINRFIAVDVTVFVAISNAILIFFILVASVTVIIFGNVIRSRVYNNLGFAIFLYAIFLFIFIYEGVDVKISAFATLVLAFAAFAAIDENRRLRRENRERENRDRKEHILSEIIDWIFSIKDITLEPLTEDNIAFRQFNIELKYGVPLNRVKLLEMETEQIINNQDLKERLLKVAELLVAVMVLDKAKNKVGDVDESLFKAFPGYVNTIKELSSMIEEEVTKGKKSKAVIVADMWLKYTIELNNAEATVLEKIVSIKSDLLKS